MSDAKFITLKIAVPSEGNPTVIRCEITVQDSAGELSRPMLDDEKQKVLAAIISFLRFLC